MMLIFSNVLKQPCASSRSEEAVWLLHVLKIFTTKHWSREGFTSMSHKGLRKELPGDCLHSLSLFLKCSNIHGTNPRSSSEKQICVI
jgi:hypothetical protein